MLYLLLYVSFFTCVRVSDLLPFMNYKTRPQGYEETGEPRRVGGSDASKELEGEGRAQAYGGKARRT